MKIFTSHWRKCELASMSCQSHLGIKSNSNHNRTNNSNNKRVRGQWTFTMRKGSKALKQAENNLVFKVQKIRDLWFLKCIFLLTIPVLLEGLQITFSSVLQVFKKIQPCFAFAKKNCTSGPKSHQILTTKKVCAANRPFPRLFWFPWKMEI
jgi:hypothetical protein